jgi:hypothetical protein
MGWEKYRITIITVCVIVVSLYNNSADTDDLSELKNLISSFEDQRIDSQDMAFFLATHGYDSSLKKNYIELKRNNMIYKLAPNGEMPGQSSIIILDLPGGIL